MEGFGIQLLKLLMNEHVENFWILFRFCNNGQFPCKDKISTLQQTGIEIGWLDII